MDINDDELIIPPIRYSPQDMEFSGARGRPRPLNILEIMCESEAVARFIEAILTLGSGSPPGPDGSGPGGAEGQK